MQALPRRAVLRAARRQDLRPEYYDRQVTDDGKVCPIIIEGGSP
jgi:hypothetical protein